MGLSWVQRRLMRREWQPEELIECWTLLDSDQGLVANKDETGGKI